MRKLDQVSKTLAVRAVVVDSGIFRRTGGPQEVFRNTMRTFDTSVTMPTKEMLVKQVRKELRDRGLDAIGKPWVVRQRLDEARETTEDIETLVSGGVPQPTTPPTAVAQTPDDIRARYAGKLRAKLADGMSTPDHAKPTDGDAGVLAAGRDAIATTTKRFRHGPPGLRTFLDFITARSMLLALLGSDDAHHDELNDLASQGVNFDLVASRDIPFATVCDDLDLQPSNVLALAHDHRLVLDASRSGALTCLLAPEGGPSSAPVLKTPDFTVATCQDCIDLINDLNGISYRHTVPVFPASPSSSAM